MKKNLSKIAEPGESKLKSLLKFASFVFTKPGLSILKRIATKRFHRPRIEYSRWIKDVKDPAQLKKSYEDSINSLRNKPLFSIIIVVSNTNIEFLPAAIDSVTKQLYPNLKLCLATRSAVNEKLKNTLKSFEEKDSRIKTEFDIHRHPVISFFDTALSVASGDYLLFMEQTDVLTEDCLFEFVRYINRHPLHEMIYADDDTINEKGAFSQPRFKPGWSPDAFLSRNYIGHPVVIKRALLEQINDWWQIKGYNGDSYYYDLLLQATELTKRPIGHIPKILYHSRVDTLQIAHNLTRWVLYNTTKRQNTIAENRKRRTSADIVKIQGVPGGYTVTYRIRSFDKVSIVIPAKDNTALLKTALDSILQKTDYPDYEIIVLNNNSTSPDFFRLVKEYEEKHPAIFRCIDASFPFNFAKLMNFGVTQSNGAYILMCNNDIEVINKNWMTQMVAHAQQKHTGAVGVKLLYPDNTIQHAGIVLDKEEGSRHIYVNKPQTDDGYCYSLKTVTNYAAVTAACLMCRKEVYNEVNGMDESLAIEYNDVDFCLKLLQHGYYNLYLPTVELYHYESATRGHPLRNKESWKQHEKELAIFKSKWQQLLDNDPFYNPNLKIGFADVDL